MTVYRAAMAHVWLLLGITFAGVSATIVTDMLYDHSIVPFALTALLLLWTNRRLGRFACPRCGSNLFVRERIALPWPNKMCSRCGLDLAHEQG